MNDVRMNMDIERTVESLLFVSTKPQTAKKLAELAGTEERAVEEALAVLGEKYAAAAGGIALVRTGKEYQMMTAPDSAAVVQAYLKDEMTGELSRPSLETLTIVAYRGPVSKAEIEQIRGVNCTLILRNLQMRGLVESEEDRKSLVVRYRVTMDFLRFLGAARVEDLPDYAELSADRTLAELIAPASSVADADGRDKGEPGSAV